MRYLIAAFAVLFVVFAFIATSFHYLLCDGTYDLAISVTSTDPSPIKWVCCQAFRGDLDADEYLANLQPFKYSIWSDRADPFDGREMRVDLPYSFKSSGAFKWDDSQPHKLVVPLEYQDGRRVGKKIEIPHRSGTTKLSVQVP
jgi:hypothetical protein